MASEPTHAFNVFVIDQDDKRAGNAQVTVVVEGEPALLVRTGNRTRADRVA